jgi:hypothetical protein
MKLTKVNFLNKNIFFGETSSFRETAGENFLGQTLGFRTFSHAREVRFVFKKCKSHFLFVSSSSSSRYSLLSRVAGILSEKLSRQPEAERALVLLLPGQVVMLRVMVLLLLLRRGLSFLLLGLRGTQVGVAHQGVDVHPVLLPVGQALPDEGLGRVRHGRLVGEVDLRRLQNDVLLEDGGL